MGKVKRTISAASAIKGWRDDLLEGEPARQFRLGPGALAQIDFGPGRLLLLGGPPGLGKTSLTLQMVLDCLRTDESADCLISNVEMSVNALLDRQLARLAGVPLTVVRSREFTDEHRARLEIGFGILESVGERLHFMRPPFSAENLAHAADEVGADLLLVDYAQRFTVNGQRNGDNLRLAVDALMNLFRKFCDAGCGIIAVSAVGRGRDSKGQSSYDSLGLASFKESGGLEYAADDCFLLSTDPDDESGEHLLLRHLKARNSEPTDIPLRFHRAYQRWEPLEGCADAGAESAAQATLQAFWNERKPQ